MWRVNDQGNTIQIKKFSHFSLQLRFTIYTKQFTVKKSAYGMSSLHVLEGTMNAERHIKDLEQHMLPSRRRLFRGRPLLLLLLIIMIIIVVVVVISISFNINIVVTLKKNGKARKEKQKQQ